MPVLGPGLRICLRICQGCRKPSGRKEDENKNKKLSLMMTWTWSRARFLIPFKSLKIVFTTNLLSRLPLRCRGVMWLDGKQPDHSTLDNHNFAIAALVGYHVLVSFDICDYLLVYEIFKGGVIPVVFLHRFQCSFFVPNLKQLRIYSTQSNHSYP